jgi:hypothetical protein
VADGAGATTVGKKTILFSSLPAFSPALFASFFYLCDHDL